MARRVLEALAVGLGQHEVYFIHTQVEYTSMQDLNPSQVGECGWLPPRPHCLGGILDQVHQ